MHRKYSREDRKPKEEKLSMEFKMKEEQTHEVSKQAKMKQQRHIRLFKLCTATADDNGNRK